MTRPVAQLVGFAKVPVPAGESRRVTLEVPAARLAFSGRDLARIVEPGALDLWTGTPSTRFARAATTLVGGVHEVTVAHPRCTRTSIEEVAAEPATA
ncbi:hypothetical protein GCM10025876_07680 [Demequina litorisediminis]|uniref:Fibronectin type III-like domain-containing protein n=1 Tax=Demequina litorisediminis TaxID=1849022 RepID=A0ABQ6IA94_9MICO|nr:hypothetical protein GCM10025876_07680 [Demequina litorisediminis]